MLKKNMADCECDFQFISILTGASHPVRLK